jgi:hypothetical protein
MLRFQVICDVCLEPHTPNKSNSGYNLTPREAAHKAGWSYYSGVGLDICVPCKKHSAAKRLRAEYGKKEKDRC